MCDTLSDIITSIVKKEILLPDFQRRFVWTEDERQARLISSVLAKMPVGSVLLLESDAKEYAYKLIGCKDRKTSKELGISGNIKALLDGQQRVTVLTNAFSDVIFKLAKQSSNLTARKALQRRFFLRLPKYKMSGQETEVTDFFGIKKLQFPYERPEADEPDFLSDDIYDAIKVVQFNASDSKCYNPFQESRKSDLVHFCEQGDEYLVPLFLMAESKNKTWFNQVLEAIVNSIKIDILDEYDTYSKEKDKKAFAKKILSESILDIAEGEVDNKETFEDLLDKQGNDWIGSFKEYLYSCINKIQLNQIVVDSNQRARAINIYENLNKGGVTLGTFELIMARFASESNENYYEKIVKNMKKKRSYPNEIFSEKLKNNTQIKDYVNSDEYIATLDLKCLDQEENDIDKTYIDAYLDVLSLYSHINSFDPEAINIEHIKRNKILEIKPKDLKNKCDDVCEALDLALLFFKMRCGIRSIKDIHYNLMLVVVAYILLKDEYRNSDRIYDYLEYWYWSSVFSGYFNTDQNGRTVTSIKKLIEFLNDGDITWLKTLKDNMCKVDYFFDEDFILLKKTDAGVLPKTFLRDCICQFYLRMTYKGWCNSDLKMNVFIEDELEKHHIIPLASLKNPTGKIKDVDADVRKDDSYCLNTPINFIYLTQTENLDISDRKLSDYIVWLDDGIKEKVGLQCEIKVDSEDECMETLGFRYTSFVDKLNDHLDEINGD